MKSNDQYEMPLYKILKDIPLCKAGTIFYYDKSDRVKGSIGAGCLKLAWSRDGNCQDYICADTIVFHADARNDGNWFELMPPDEVGDYIKVNLFLEGQQLYKRVLK